MITLTIPGKPVKTPPTVDRLRELLRLDEESGELSWKVDRCRRAVKAGSRALATMDNYGYLVGSIDGVGLKAHRVVWALTTGAWPAGEIDHRNGVKTDNRPANLRDVDCVANQRNKPLSARNSSGVTGVYWSKADSKWRARISTDEGRRNLGMFESFDAACEARWAAEHMYGYTDRHGKERAA